MIEPRPGDNFRRGQVLNNTYEIEGLLGRGGTGEVYRARNLISGRIVAIKALNAQFSGQDGYIELMRREEQMRDIRDDAVVRYTECSRNDQGHVFLVMDFIDGPSMADVMARRRMEPRELMIVAHRIAEGLVAAHRQGIVHRDLSPDNVILRDGSPERATIIDFGIAKDTAAGARTIVGNDFAGKYEYAAPEQLDGKAEPRSDLYALGALLLAAYRGQTPFSGATPGEMVRRKSQPLDTAGVPEPLKGLVEWLSDPALARRAPSAAAVVEKLGQGLRGAAPSGASAAGKTRLPQSPSRRGKGVLVWLLLPLMLAAALGGAAFSLGYLDRFMIQPLPLAKPYLIAADFGAEGAKLTGHAPDAAAATAIRAAWSAGTGRAAPEDALVLAEGVPAAGWASAMAAVFPLLNGLESWDLSVSDLAVTLTGAAPDLATRDRITTDLKAWATAAGLRLEARISAGPAFLTAKAVQEVLAPRATCGALTQSLDPDASYGPADPVTIRGFAPDAALSTDVQLALRDLLADRPLVVELTVLNPDLCAVRAVLPQVPGNALSIWLGQGVTGDVNLSGIFGKGDNPLVEVQAPVSLNEGRLWVVVVDNTGKVINLIPNMNNGETALSNLGTVEDGVRRVRVLHSIAEFRADQRLLATTVNDGDFGKSEVIAILAREDLFDTRRPRDESVAAFAEALAAVQAEKPGVIFGIASRILESRP